MENTPAFGKAVREQRGDRTQTEIANLGGPYRQLQGRIEKGDHIEVPDKALRQFDVAFGWAPGTAATILRGSQKGLVAAPPPRIAVGALGYDAETGQAVEFPARLRTTLAPGDLVDAICSWPGIVVADTQVFDSPDRSALRGLPGRLPEWVLKSEIGPTGQRLASQWGAGADDRVALTVGVQCAGIDSVAIDPIPGMTNSEQASRLIAAVRDIRPDSTSVAGRELEISHTLLQLACQRPHPERHRRALLTVERPFLRTDDVLYEPLSPSWKEFLDQAETTLPMEYAAPSVAALLSGLTTARDNSIDIILDKSTTPARIAKREVPTVIFPQDLSAGTLLLHDAEVSPELPAVVTWATDHPVLVIAQKPAPTFSKRLSQPNVVEFLLPYSYGLADTRLAPGWALLSRATDIKNPLLTFSDGDGRRSANVVLAYTEAA
ncbi:hypothetical protein LIX17_25250 (plasmid) [Mycobacterium avium subsp. hominissuis]|uniref:hypothetical protein n=1 Tax=Mycobacterium avium TaxID=1764 RepID=UPI003140AA12